MIWGKRGELYDFAYKTIGDLSMTEDDVFKHFMFQVDRVGRATTEKELANAIDTMMAFHDYMLTMCD